MKLKISRETLLKPLQTTATIAANRANDSGQIRGGVLLRLKDNHLELTGTGNRLQLLEHIGPRRCRRQRRRDCHERHETARYLQ